MQGLNKVVRGGFVVGVFLAASQVSRGALLLNLNEAFPAGGGVNFTILDNDANDSDPTVGSIIFHGAVGNEAVNLVAGTSNRGSGMPPILQLETLNVRNSSSSTLGFAVDLLDTDFTYPTTSTGRSLSLTAAGGGTVIGASATPTNFIEVQASADPTNAQAASS